MRDDLLHPLSNFSAEADTLSSQLQPVPLPRYLSSFRFNQEPIYCISLKCFSAVMDTRITTVALQSVQFRANTPAISSLHPCLQPARL
jgi:hypothetical protein